MREYLQVLLAREGYEVVTSASSPDAIRVLEKEPVDLVISDMKLGTGSGMEVLKAAKERPRRARR